MRGVITSNAVYKVGQRSVEQRYFNQSKWKIFALAETSCLICLMLKMHSVE